MTIGEKIIVSVMAENLVLSQDFTPTGRTYFWLPSAADQLNALVAAHVEEQVRLRLEAERRKQLYEERGIAEHPAD